MLPIHFQVAPPGRLALLFAAFFGVFAGGIRPAAAQPLPERRTITLHVAMTDGKPAAGLTFVISRTNAREVAESWSFDGVTDANGELTVHDIEDGSYHMEILETNRGVTGVPGNFIADASTTLWTVTIPARAGLHLRVLGPDGTPEIKKICYIDYVVTAPGEAVPERPRRTRNPFGGVNRPAPTGMTGVVLRTDENGYLPIEDLPLGTYSDLEIFAEGEGFAQAAAPYDLTTSGIREATIKLQRGGDLKIHVLEGTPAAPGRPVGMYGVHLEDDTPADTAQIDMAEHIFGRHNNESIDGAGYIWQSNLVPGSYTIGLAGLPQDQLNGPATNTVQVNPGTVSETTFYVKPQEGGELHLSLTDFNGKPLANTNFDLSLQLPPPPPDPKQPKAPRHPRRENRLARSDARGNVTIYPLKPGHYSLTALAMNDNMAEVGQGRAGSADFDIDPKTPASLSLTLDAFLVSAQF